MTLTSLLPTLRDSIPAPLDPDAWPARTRATTTDVVVAGVSACRLAELCTTPCVHGGAAVLPHTGGIASPTQSTTIVLTRVIAVTPEGVALDADLAAHDARWREVRLIGRVSHARDTRMRLQAGTTDGQAVHIALPADLRAGDLLAVPCPGCFSVGEVRPDVRG